MDADADITGIAALLADPARVAMLDALFDGHALSAGEPARCARVSAPTASTHLRRLLDLGWLVRGRVPRGLHLSDAGRDGLVEVFGCAPPSLRDQATGG